MRLMLVPVVLLLLLLLVRMLELLVHLALATCVLRC